MPGKSRKPRARRKSKPKFDLKEITVNLGLFNFEVITVIGKEEEAHRYVRWKCDDYCKDFVLGDAYGKFFHREGYPPIIWIPRYPKTAREYGTLAHECLHVAGVVGEWAGIGFNGDTDEVYCHTVSYIMTKVLELGKK